MRKLEAIAVGRRIKVAQLVREILWSWIEKQEAELREINREANRLELNKTSVPLAPVAVPERTALQTPDQINERLRKVSGKYTTAQPKRRAA